MSRKKIDIAEDRALLISSRGEGYYTWDVVFFESPEERIKIGSYSTIPGSTENMCYNSNCVVFFNFDVGTKELVIRSIFDIETRQMIEGTQEELKEYYVKAFEEGPFVKKYRK